MSTRETTLFFGSEDLLPVSVMSSASGPSPILTQTTGNELDFYLVVPRYNFSMKPTHYSKYYTHCEFLWRLVVDPRSQTSGIGITIECGGPVDKKKSPWSCCARLMMTLVHPKRWESIGISLPIQGGDEPSNLIRKPVSVNASKTSAAPPFDPQVPTDAVPTQGSDLDPPKESKLSEAAAAVLPPAPPVLETQLASAASQAGEAPPPNDSPPSAEEGQTPVESPQSANSTDEPTSPVLENKPVFSKESPAISDAAKSPKTTEAGSATASGPSGSLPAQETKPLEEETSDEPPASDPTKSSEALLPVPPSQSATTKGSHTESALETSHPTRDEDNEKEYIPRDLQVTTSHTYSSTEYSLTYTDNEFAPFALLQPGMFCDDDMNIVLRVKILANDFYNRNRGNAGSEVATVYGSSNVTPAIPPNTSIIPPITSASSSFIPSAVFPPPEPLPLELTCRRALVQEIVDLDKKIGSVSTDIAADILKKEIEVLNEGLEELSSSAAQSSGTKKAAEKIKDALSSLLRVRKPRNVEANNGN